MKKKTLKNTSAVGVELTFALVLKFKWLKFLSFSEPNGKLKIDVFSVVESEMMLL